MTAYCSRHFLEFGRSVLDVGGDMVVLSARGSALRWPRWSGLAALTLMMATATLPTALGKDLVSLQDQLLADTAESPRIKFSWKERGFGECSRSCLGGVQDTIITCYRDDDGKVASPFMCAQDTMPERRIRICNNHPCPPRWNSTEFSKCSHECGGMGIKTREVTCVHEVTNYNLVVVPNNRCPPPPPPDRVSCNILDCQPSWNATTWSKCSRPCGGGIKTRQVQCVQVMAQNNIMPQPASMCPAHARPADQRTCNRNKTCAPDDARPPRHDANGHHQHGGQA